MDFNELEKVAEIAKATSEAAQNFYSIIEKIFAPRGINLALLNGHIEIIDSYMNRDDIDEFSKMAFLSNYKRIIKEYKNSKTIANLAVQQITKNARPQDVEEDWFAFFFDKVRLVSDESVQTMWAQILASEVNCPGTFSRSLLHTLSIMSSTQARSFCNITRFCMQEYKNEKIVHPFLFVSANFKAYERAGITADALLDLEHLGLIQCDFKNEFIFLKKKVLRYGNRILEIHGDPNNEDKIKVGNIRFTSNGQILFCIVDNDFKQFDQAILDFSTQKFKRRGCTVYINNQRVD